MIRKAKIVATIGPASWKPAMLEALLEAGMDVARLNLSFADYPKDAQVIDDLRRLSTEHRCPVAILADLPGPKIRTKNGKAVQLYTGQRLVLTGEEVGNRKRIGMAYAAQVAQDVRRGARILLDDGGIELKVLETRRGQVVCQVVTGGPLGKKKGVNLPGTKLNHIPPLTPEDKKHLRFALEHRVDYIGQSFVRKADDVRQLKQLIQNAGCDTPVIAKIEKPEALGELDDILEVADGVMVARGDLGVEMDLEQVPSAQRKIITWANRERIPVITATQMLQSMIENPRPTRAEVGDVSSAIAQGTGAVMLSGETSVGRYPREAVESMDKIIRATEASVPVQRHRQPARNIPEAVADSMAAADDQFDDIKAIVVFTQTGYSARLVSKARPTAPIIAFTPQPEVCSRLALLWGVLPRRIKPVRYVEELTLEAERRLLRERLAKRGDVVALVGSTVLYREGKTNLLEFHTIGT